MNRHETVERLQRDRERLLAHLQACGAGRPALLALYPPWQCVRLHRASHRQHRAGRPRLARLLWHLNLLLTGADISPHSDLGAGLLVPHPLGVCLAGRAGRDLTAGAMSGLGARTARDEIGGGPGLPVLGDGVVLAAQAGVLGPVRIGHRARIGPGCLVTDDLPDDAVVEPSPARFTTSRSAGTAGERA